MAVEIQELDVVPAPEAAREPAAPADAAPAGAPHPALAREIERAARLQRSRDLRLQAD